MTVIVSAANDNDGARRKRIGELHGKTVGGSHCKIMVRRLAALLDDQPELNISDRRDLTVV